MVISKSKEIQRAKTPESVGVSSAVVQDYIDDCLSQNKELHSIIVLRHGKIACEAYRAPYDENKSQMVYSISKSFTSTAIGLAIEEGFFSLETKILDIFPELRKPKFDFKLENLTVKHLLNMTSGKSVSPFMDKTKDNWLEQIFDSPWHAAPGEKFAYISENIYVLCAIIHKMTAQSVLEFLQPRLFEPLGIEKPLWETCPLGIETGGWGMVIKPMDIAKFTLCYQQMGVYNGEQIIPKWWVEEATKKQSDNTGYSQDRDTVAGYGYCFGRCAGYEKAYRSDGMFSQFGIVFEDLDACVISTAGEIDEQPMRDLIWKYFPKAFIDDDKKAKSTPIHIKDYPLAYSPYRSTIEKQISGKLIKFAKTITNNVAGFPVSMIPMAGTFMEADKAGNMNEITLDFFKDEMKLTWIEGEEVNSVMVGLDGKRRWDNIIVGQLPHVTASTAKWLSEKELQVHIRPIDVPTKRILIFKFEKSNIVTLTPSCIPESKNMFISLESNIKSIIKQPLVQNALVKLLPHAAPIVSDVTQIGRYKNR